MIRNSPLARTLAAALTGALLLSAAGAALAQRAARRAHVDPRSGVEWAWSGRLSAPSAAAPTAIARSFAATLLPAGVRARDLRPVRSAALPRGGSLIVLEQRAGAAGLRVVGAQVAVRVDAAGRVRWAASRARALPSDLALIPSLSAEQAAAVAGWVPGRLPGAPRSELVVYAPAGSDARLAYQVTLPFDPMRTEIRRLLVDAQSGRVLARDNLVRHVGQARAFAVNPVETPGTQVVQLAGLDDGAETLTGPDAVAQACIDNGTCSDIGGIFTHDCAFLQTALADENGDFLAYDYASDTDPEDAFAEVQIFHHTAVAFARARELGGFEGFDQPLPLVANFRQIDFNDTNCDGPVYLGDQEFQPFDNAFFTPFGLRGSGAPTLVFGQGSVNDFTYDGDVVYHEFGHAVMFQIAPDLGYERRDQYGVDTTPGGLNEGYADLMTMFVTGDPELAEYASINFGVEILRNMDNDRTCAGLVGDGHQDAEVISGVMWAAREALPEADRTVFDEAVFAAQRAFDASETFASAAQLTLMEVEAALSPVAAKAVAAVFTARGFDDCATRVADAAVPHRLLWLLGGFSPEDTPRPSVVQWRLALDASAASIQVDIAEMLDLFGSGTVEVDLEVGVKPGSEPILWTEGTEEQERTADYTLSAPFNYTENAEGVVSARAVVEGPFEPGEYHLQLVGRELTVGAQTVTISAVPLQGAPDAGPAEPDAAVDAGDDDGDGDGAGDDGNDGDGDGDDGGDDSDDEGGCGCRTARPEGAASVALLLVAALWLGARRRRTRQPNGPAGARDVPSGRGRPGGRRDAPAGA